MSNILMNGVLDAWVGDVVTGDVTITDENAKQIYQDNFEGVLRRVIPEGYEITIGHERQINFVAEAVYSVDYSGRIIIHIERR